MAIRYLSKLGYVKALSFKLQSVEVSNVPEMQCHFLKLKK